VHRYVTGIRLEERGDHHGNERFSHEILLILFEVVWSKRNYIDPTLPCQCISGEDLYIIETCRGH
jgi:hypothetical protein